LRSKRGLQNGISKSILEKEAQSLEQRYGYGDTQSEEQLLLQNVAKEPLVGREKQLENIRAKCQEFEVMSFNAATLQEEQERELSPENEREQQVELPPASAPLTHGVHDDVWFLVTRGVLKRSGAFQPAFETLRSTTAFNSYDTGAWPKDLLVTTDFANTIRSSHTGAHFLDWFLKPVQWVVSWNSGNGTQLVIVSPYEAQELLPSIRQEKRVTLHVYSPRTSVSVQALDSLEFCAIPAVPKTWSTPPLTTQLNLFAGQLYFQTYEEYIGLCDFLGLCSRPPGNHIKVACDGFVTRRCRAKYKSEMALTCPFTISPVAFLKMVIEMRRKGHSFAMSHFGKILNGELLTREHFNLGHIQHSVSASKR
jgi:hypothetical protein